MDKEFESVRDRAGALGVTEMELVSVAGLNYTTYWRAREGLTKKQVTRAKVLNAVKAAIEKIEGPCSLCGKARRANCPEFGCPA
jgi:hypothetical protein